MTEYDSSPGAMRNFMAKQARVGKWAANASANQSSFEHPFQGMTSHRSSASASTARPGHTRRGSATMSSSSARTGTSRSYRPPTAVSKRSMFSGPKSSRVSGTMVPGSTRVSGPPMSMSSSRTSSRMPSSFQSRVSSSHRSSSMTSPPAAPTMRSGMGSSFTGGRTASVTPSQSVSQAGFSRAPGSSAPSRRSTLPPGSGINGAPSYSTRGVVNAEGYSIMPQRGQSLDVYVVPRR